MFLIKDLMEVFISQTDSIFGILFLGLLWYFIWTSWGREQKFIQYFSQHQDFDEELEKVFKKIEEEMNNRRTSWECIQKLSMEINNIKDNLHGFHDQINEIKNELGRIRDKLDNDLDRLEENLNRDLRETKDDFRDLLKLISQTRKGLNNRE